MVGEAEPRIFKVATLTVSCGELDWRNPGTQKVGAKGDDRIGLMKVVGGKESRMMSSDMGIQDCRRRAGVVGDPMGHFEGLQEPFDDSIRCRARFGSCDQIGGFS